MGSGFDVVAEGGFEVVDEGVEALGGEGPLGLLGGELVGGRADLGDGGVDLVGGASALAGVPAALVHGRLDLSGPPDVAWRLGKAWPGANLTLLYDAGHGAGEPGMAETVVAATDAFALT